MFVLILTTKHLREDFNFNKKVIGLVVCLEVDIDINWLMLK